MSKKRIESYSSMSKFETCPRQWESQYVLKDIKFTPNTATEWGKAAHDAMDKRFKTGNPLMGRFRDFEPMALSIEKIKGEIKSEYEMAIDIDDNAVDFWDKSAVQRGKADVIIFDGDKCNIIDHKFGKYRPQTEELEFFAKLAFQIHPEIMKIKTTYIWYKKDGPTTIDFFDRENDLPLLIQKFDDKITRIEEALIHDLFPAKRSGLCQNYCGSPTCKHSGNFQG